MTPDALYGHMTRSREANIELLSSHPLDLLVLGGGITGASVFHLAATNGLKVALIDKNDFTSGSSSRSSKIFHGGVLDLVKRRWRLVRGALTERDRWMRDYADLIERMPAYYLHSEHQFPSPFMMKWIMRAYQLFADSRAYRSVEANRLEQRLPWLKKNWLGATQSEELLVDDARLVQRLINEGRAAGGLAINYLDYRKRHESTDGMWDIRVKDSLTQVNVLVSAAQTINATGVWSNWVSGIVSSIRPSRGSHVVLPMKNHRIAEVVACNHPDDGRVVYIWPWEGMLVVGTTDQEDSGALSYQPAISMSEYSYLMKVVQLLFGKSAYRNEDVISCFAGWRPLVDVSGGRGLESTRSREHLMWTELGMATIVGGSLTNGRLAALSVLEHLYPDQQWHWKSPKSSDVLNANRLGHWIDIVSKRRKITDEGTVEESKTHWQWLVDACIFEQIETLGDLLLRRTRLGFQLPQGAAEVLNDVKEVCIEHLGWSDERWEFSQKQYREETARYFSVS